MLILKGIPVGISSGISHYASSLLYPSPGCLIPTSIRSFEEFPHPKDSSQRRIGTKEIIALTLVLLLTGCLRMGAACYDVAIDYRFVGKQAVDTEIWGQIKKDLLQSSLNGTDKMSVFCRRGIVFLAGTVGSGLQAGREAVRIAGQVRA